MSTEIVTALIVAGGSIICQTVSDRKAKTKRPNH